MVVSFIKRETILLYIDTIKLVIYKIISKNLLSIFFILYGNTYYFIYCNKKKKNVKKFVSIKYCTIKINKVNGAKLYFL